MSSTKSEKQAIDAKIAKVREVIRNVSNNDIVLALHTFDMDVAKTISAFTTGDVDNAIGTWKKKSGKNNKLKKKNKNGGGNADSSSATSTTTETPKVSSIISSRASEVTPIPIQRPVQSSSAQPTKHSVDSKPINFSDLDSILHELDIKSARIQKNIDNAHREQSAVILSIQTALNSRERQLIAHLEKSRQQVDSSVQQQRSIIQKLKRSPKQPSFEDISRLKSDQALLDSLLEVKFAVHGDKALKAVEKLGSGFLPATNAEPVHCHPQPTVVYHTNGTTHTPPSNQQQEPTKAAHPTQPQQPEHNGRPDNKHVNGTDIKHSVSHSSLASEENDSGLGQISPVSQEKNAVQIADGGFLFSSDGLDADQLAKLKAQVAETLKAQGIDHSILTSIASGGSVAPARRRQNQQKRGKENGKPPPNNKDNKKAAGKTIKS